MQPQYFSWLVVVPLVAFWFWMFNDMINNYELSPTERQFWTIAFIFGNALAAGYYYFTVYRSRR